MKRKIGKCQGCGKDRVFANVRHKLCTYCNQERLHPNGKKAKSLRPMSKKGQEAKNKYKETIDTLSSSGHFDECSGCGQKVYISPSHIVRRSKRKDLEADPENIRPHCMQRVEGDEYGNKGCHDRWESMNYQIMATLKDFENNMDYLYLHAEDTWQRVMNTKDEG